MMFNKISIICLAGSIALFTATDVLAQRSQGRGGFAGGRTMNITGGGNKQSIENTINNTQNNQARGNITAAPQSAIVNNSQIVGNANSSSNAAGGRATAGSTRTR